MHLLYILINYINFNTDITHNMVGSQIAVKENIFNFVYIEFIHILFVDK